MSDYADECDAYSRDIQMITQRQRKVYEILREGRFPVPSMAEIAVELDVVPSTVRTDLLVLESKGLIERGRGARAIRVTGKPDTSSEDHADSL